MFSLWTFHVYYKAGKHTYVSRISYKEMSLGIILASVVIVLAHIEWVLPKWSFLTYRRSSASFQEINPMTSQNRLLSHAIAQQGWGIMNVKVHRYILQRGIWTYIAVGSPVTILFSFSFNTLYYIEWIISRSITFAMTTIYLKS